jgi:hypothetical protein
MAVDMTKTGENMLMVVVGFVVACGGGASVEATAVDPVKVSAGLVAADLADGTEDKIVHKCAGCSLAMAGNPAHAIATRGYTLHMCSAACKANYEGDLDNNLSKLAK